MHSRFALSIASALVETLAGFKHAEAICRQGLDGMAEGDE